MPTVDHLRKRFKQRILYAPLYVVERYNERHAKYLVKQYIMAISSRNHVSIVAVLPKLRHTTMTIQNHLMLYGYAANAIRSTTENTHYQTLDK